MNVIRVLGRSSPFTFAIIGLAIALSIPFVRNGLRRAVIIALGGSGVLDAAQKIEPLRNELIQLLERAKTVGQDVATVGNEATRLLEESERLIKETKV